MIPPVETSRYQFTLAGLLSLVTVVAAIFGFARLVAAGGTQSSVVFGALVFWPTLLGLARCCRLRCVATKARIAALTASVFVVTTAFCVHSSDLVLGLILTRQLYPVGLFIAVIWIPQVIVIWIIRLDIRDWSRRHNERSSTPSTGEKGKDEG